ncbi:hypothetical protein N2152v2_007731 [Parachlorella kessleri]
MAEARAVEPGHQADWVLPAENDGWVLSHNALRLDLKDFDRLLVALRSQLAAGKPLEAWQADAIRRYWKQAVHMLVVHHDSEEELYFPLMRTKFPVDAHQTSDHVKIVKQVEGVGQDLEALLTAQGVEGQLTHFRPLQDDFARFKQLCEEHFREEEEVTLPALRHHFTPAEVQPVAKKISKMYSLLDMGNYLRPMSHEERVAWMTRVKMPTFVQWLMLAQCRRYDRNVMRPFEAAIKGEQPGWSLF